MKTIFRFLAALLILQSISFSQSWFPLNAGSTSNFSYINFLDQNTGFIGSPLYRTTNGGSSWQFIPGGNNLRSVCFLDINTGYATDGSFEGPGNLYKTTNSGMNWVMLPNAEYVCQIYFQSVDTGYFVNEFDWNISDFLGTTDGGLTWNVLHYYMAFPGGAIDAVRYFKLQFTGPGEAYLSAEVARNMVWSAAFLLKTTNKGIDWNYIIGPSAYVFRDFSFTPGNHGFSVGRREIPGLESDTGVVFDYFGNQSYAAYGLLNGTSSPSSSVSFAVGDAGVIIKTSNAGINWQPQNSGTNQRLNAIKFINSTTGYIVGNNGTILKTNTGGETPLSVTGQVRYQDNNQPVSSGYIKALRYDSLSKQILTLDSASIQSNGAYTMSHLPPGISFDIMAFENDENELSFVPTYYPSTTSWQNATALTLSSNLTGIDVLVYRINNTGGPYHIAGSINGIFQTMINLNGAIAYAKIGSIYQAFSITDNSGHYRIDSLNPGTYTLVVDRMGFFTQVRQVVITNFSKDTIDILLNNGTLLGTTQEGNVIPDGYSLGVNYPNPFNPSTKISFSIPKDSKIGIKIYDLRGREVAVLVNEERKAGNYSVEWNASEFASGVYFCRMEAGSFVSSQKIVLLK